MSAENIGMSKLFVWFFVALRTPSVKRNDGDYLVWVFNLYEGVIAWWASDFEEAERCKFVFSDFFA